MQQRRSGSRCGVAAVGCCGLIGVSKQGAEERWKGERLYTSQACLLPERAGHKCNPTTLIFTVTHAHSHSTYAPTGTPTLAHSYTGSLFRFFLSETQSGVYAGTSK